MVSPSKEAGRPHRSTRRPPLLKQTDWRSILPELLGIAAALTMRGALALHLAPGRDEAAYWYNAWHRLDASYSWALAAGIRASTALVGDSAWAMRLPGLVSGIVSIFAVAAATRLVGGSARVASVAALAWASSPWQMYSATIVHPDALLAVGTLGVAISVARSRSRPTATSLLGLGASAALSSLSKLTGALLLGTALWALVRSRAQNPRAVVAALGIVAASIAALASSLDTTLLRGVLDFGRFDPSLGWSGRGTLLGGELALLAGPGFLVAAGFGCWAWRSQEARNTWPLFWLALALSTFFLAFALLGRAKANWFLPGLALAIPAGAVALERSGLSRVFRRITWLGAGLSLGASTFFLTPLETQESIFETLRLGRVDGWYAQHTGGRERDVSPTMTWSGRFAEYGPFQVDPRIAELATSHEPVGLLSNDYGLAFQTAFALGRNVVVSLPWDPVFASQSEPEEGADLVFLSSQWATLPNVWKARFRQVTELKPDLATFSVSSMSPGTGSNRLYVWWCEDYTPPPEDSSPKGR